MIISPLVLSPRVPGNVLAEEQKNHARFVDILLHDIGRRCVDFDAALKLFDSCTSFLENIQNRTLHAEEYSLRWYWRAFSVREAVATIYRVGEDMEICNKNLNKCPTLVRLVDHKLRREAQRVFLRSFPGAAGLRHGIQHFAKLYGSPEAFAQNAAGEENFVNHLEGRTVKSVFEGAEASFEMSSETLLKLNNVRDLFWASYIAAGAG